jgi:DNA repair photolyase
VPHLVDNPPNPWSSTEVEWLEPPPEAKLEVYEEQAKSALSHNNAPDVPFAWSVNPYRGCLHACAYCYARPTHQYLGFGAGTDFDRRIVVKTNIAERLAAELDRKSWRYETVPMSGNTDCYQAIEASYRLTRGCLEALVARQNPFSVITKSALVARDVDLFTQGARYADNVVTVSLPFVRDDQAAAIEPWAARPQRRLDAMKAVADAGAVVCVSIAPLIIGLNDDQIAEILERAKEAGAQRAFMIPLRLPEPVDAIFEQRLRRAFPDRADRVMSGVDEVRAGRRNDNRVVHRMTGQGPRWAIARQLYEQRARALGYASSSVEEMNVLNADHDRRPPRRGQLGLFDDGQ